MYATAACISSSVHVAQPPRGAMSPMPASVLAVKPSTPFGANDSQSSGSSTSGALLKNPPKPPVWQLAQFVSKTVWPDGPLVLSSAIAEMAVAAKQIAATRVTRIQRIFSAPSINKIKGLYLLAMNRKGAELPLFSFDVWVFALRQN
jgi:hypothetical protein